MDKRGVPGEVTPVALRLPGLSTGYQTVDTVIDLQLFWSGKNSFFIISEQIALPIFLLRYVSHGAGVFPEAARCALSGLPNRTAL
ncbi:hypothetical protein [Klebsiella quasivariicola]|uniref:hypothetical protein n=1 Tax=Klebsiella quasivariicola TaxID=2026240 RepID=UPI00247A1998|nr:hypothetical protein [Klebsiella quasivariicola]